MLGHSFTRTILTFAIGLGIIRIAISFLAVQFGGPVLLFESLTLATILTAVMIAGMIIAGYQLRKENGGILDWGKTTIGLFSVYALAGLLVVAFNSLNFHVIVPEWVDLIPEVHLPRLTFSGSMYEYISSLIFGGILAVVLGFFIKREKVKVVG